MDGKVGGDDDITVRSGKRWAHSIRETQRKEVSADSSAIRRKSMVHADPRH